MSLAAGLNWAWMQFCQRELAAFHRATHDVEAAQTGVLRQILRANRDSDFGREYCFDSLGTPSAFQSMVPLADYEALRPWIDRAAAGEVKTLTSEPVKLFQPTSGTTTAEKLIPYTSALQRQYQRGINAWIGDLFRHRSGVRKGRAYWSITPAISSPHKTRGGIPIGFDDDAAYLGTLMQLAARRLLVAPPQLARLTETRRFRLATLSCLLAARDLALISIWNPSFLTVLLSNVDEFADEICSNVRRGFISGAPAVPLPADRRRADELHSLLRSHATPSERIRQFWPQLALISCWGDSAAESPLHELKRLFPEVEIQRKGLLATEGFVSLPLCDQPGAALAVRSHFFEFVPAASPARDASRSVPLLAHQLAVGEHYNVVVTTGGGLYRYQLHDEVLVVGHLQQCPLLRFVGKSDRVCDLVGEKLAEPFACRAVQDSLAACNVSSRFCMLIPLATSPPGYRLLLQTDQLAEHLLIRIANQLEQVLCQNPYYRHAVELGQLSPLEVAMLSPQIQPRQIQEDVCRRRGQRLGNIKSLVMDRWPGWEAEFRQHVIAVGQANAGNRRSLPASQAASR